jgi:hypothetical protein
VEAPGGGAAKQPPVTPKTGPPVGAGAEGAAEGALTKVPGGVAQGIEGGTEGAVAGAAARGLVGGAVRFVAGAAIGVAIGVLAGLAYSYLVRKQIEIDIAHTLKNIPEDRQRKIQARIDALPAGKKKLARVTLDYTMWRSTLGFLGGPDAYQWQSVRLVGIHPGNEELDFPAAVTETLSQDPPGFYARSWTIRISYTVPLE